MRPARQGALALRFPPSFAVVEWLFTWPGIGIALDSCALVRTSGGRFAGSSRAVDAAGSPFAATVAAADGTDGSGVPDELTTPGATTTGVFNVDFGSGGSAGLRSQPLRANSASKANKVTNQPPTACWVETDESAITIIPG